MRHSQDRETAANISNSYCAGQSATGKEVLQSCGASIGIAVAASYFVDPFDRYLANIALASLATALIPFFRFVIDRDFKHLTIFIPAFLTWLYFLNPYLRDELVTHSYRVIPVDQLPLMALSSAGGVLMMIIGFYLSFREKLRNPISPEEFRISTPTLGRIGQGFMVLGVVSNVLDYYFPTLLKPLGQLLSLIDFAPVLAISVGLLYWLRGGRATSVTVTLSVYFVFELVLRTSETLFSKIAFIFAGLLIVYVLERRRVPWIVVTVVFLLIFPIFNARKLFRMDAHDRWHNTKFEERAKIPGLLEIGYDYLIESYKIWEWDKLGESLSDQSESRFENISFLGQCTYLVEKQGKELKRGETFWWLPITPLPRAVFPWKPINDHATTLAVEYGVKGKQSKAAFNFPMLVEMYINFGYWGIVVISFFQGALYKWCLRFVAFGVGDFNLLIFINILWHLEKVESNITIIFGGIFQALIAWWVVSRLFSIRFTGESVLSR